MIQYLLLCSVLHISILIFSFFVGDFASNKAFKFAEVSNVLNRKLATNPNESAYKFKRYCNLLVHNLSQ